MAKTTTIRANQPIVLDDGTILPMGAVHAVDATEAEKLVKNGSASEWAPREDQSTTTSRSSRTRSTEASE